MTRVSFLHLEPRPGELDHNRALIERGILRASELGAEWIITPELAVSGYFFADVIGTDWIETQPDNWTQRLCKIAEKQKVNLILGQPERDATTGILYNSAFAIDSSGKIAGKHRKICIHPGPEEGWSRPGNSVTPISINGFKLGILICADIYEPDLAIQMKNKGAQLLICPVAWGAKYGPGDRWEKISIETGLPLWICNRTGAEKGVNWAGGESVVIKNGKSELVHSGIDSCVLTFNWSMETMKLTSSNIETHPLVREDLNLSKETKFEQ
ncbi:MAG: carbon-nitrogen hydrolase family protein [Dehalogenimonas sp.]